MHDAIGEVEATNDLIAMTPQVGAFGQIEHMAPSAARLMPVGEIPKRHERAASVTRPPVEHQAGDRSD
jgi:hypothetical protein